MEIVETAAALHEACDSARSNGQDVGFVPTMGALHDGHMALIRRAREETDLVAVSVFLNPLQFGEDEDYEAYPRVLESDSGQAEAESVDLLFAPSIDEMYPSGYPPPLTVDPGPVGDRLEGAARPGHFRGVLTVVAKLFDLVGTSRAYFGEKDAQQLFLVQRMARELAMHVEVVPCPTVREADGLAMSSRNASLSPADREAAPCLFRALEAAREMFASGERVAHHLTEEMARRVAAEPIATIDYATLVDPVSFDEPYEIVGQRALALIAARVGHTRLIDSMRLEA